MIVEIRRASNEPVLESLELVCDYVDRRMVDVDHATLVASGWWGDFCERGTRHVFEGGGTVSRILKHTMRVVSVANLEELVAKYGRVVIRPGACEEVAYYCVIADDYLE